MRSSQTPATVVPILACFDDSWLRRVLPGWLVARAERAAETARPSRAQQVAVAALVGVVAVLSIAPVRNLVSAHQAMNTSFNRLELVNTYGAFGSVGRERHEIIFEGTDDQVIADDTAWRAYEFECKPGNLARRPCLVAPYQYRLDWQIWFAAMSTPARYPWTLHLVCKLLHNDPGALSLLANDPFPDDPPRYVRAQFYRYRFTTPDERRQTGRTWNRDLLGAYFAPASLKTQ